MITCHPIQDNILLTERLAMHNPNNVLLIFFHGLGDILMFLNSFELLKNAYPNIQFDIGIEKNIKYETFLSNCIPISNDNPEENPVIKNYDLVAKIDFPMCEYEKEMITKGEFCCKKELGITPISGHPKLKKENKKIISVHFNVTALPDQGVQENEAKLIWETIIENGFIPLEVHFRHVYHNPRNLKYNFVDNSVRKCKPEITSLISIIQNSAGFIGPTSGPFHVALSCLDPNRILYLEKDYPASRYTKENVNSLKINEIKKEDVTNWIKTLS